MHLTLLPYLSASGELKTKPTQHSVKELQSIGLAPDVLVCRSEHPIPEREREKIALFCNVRKEAVIPAYDLKTIYEAPLAYHRAGLIRRCWTPSDQPRAQARHEPLDRCDGPARPMPRARCGWPSSANIPSLKMPINPSPRR
jgi:CTP synthase